MEANWIRVRRAHVDADEVQMYEGADYSGDSMDLHKGNYDTAELHMGGLDDNSLSSVRVVRGLTLTIFEDDGWQGDSFALYADQTKLPVLNDATSSVKIAMSGVQLFAHPDYNVDVSPLGWMVELPRTDGDYTLGQLVDLGFVAAEMSSIRIPFGCKVTLFTADQFGGTSTTLSTDACALYRTSDGGPLGFDDATLSLKVRCGHPESMMPDGTSNAITLSAEIATSTSASVWILPSLCLSVALGAYLAIAHRGQRGSQRRQGEMDVEELTSSYSAQ